MRASRDVVIKELMERFDVRATAEAAPIEHSASVGMNTIKLVKEKVGILVIAIRELHGVVMDPEHVAMVWCVRVAGQIMSRTVKGTDGLTAFQRAFQRSCLPFGEKHILYLEASEQKVPITDKFWNGIFVGHEGRI